MGAGIAWAGAAALPIGVIPGPVACGQVASIEMCNTVPLGTTATDQHGQVFTVAGLSSIAWMGRSAPGVDRFVAAMDNSNKLVFIEAESDAGGCLNRAAIVGGLALGETRDFEGLALSDGGVYLAEEGTPAVHEYDLATGARRRTIGAPPVFASRRANFGFESLALRPPGSAHDGLWTANEEALTVDGPLSTISAGTVVRLLRFTPAGSGWSPAQQFAYRCEPIHGLSISGSRSGVSDMIDFAGVDLGVLERSLAFSADGLFENRIYAIDPAAATDVSGLTTLVGQSYIPATKRLLWRGHPPGNMEGLALAGTVGFQARTMVGIIDDGDPISVNMLVGFLVRFRGCFADFNQDGGIDGQDVESFFAAWEQGSVDADANQDGGVDGADVEVFFDQWSEGSCP